MAWCITWFRHVHAALLFVSLRRKFKMTEKYYSVNCNCNSNWKVALTVVATEKQWVSNRRKGQSNLAVGGIAGNWDIRTSRSPLSMGTRASVCLSVCPRSYGCNFSSILIKFCTEVGDTKSKKAFVSGQNPMTPSPILPQFFTPVMHFQQKGPDTAVTRSVVRLWQLRAQTTC